jgi:mRNA-degrading endonuclease YafQ of YafQ-DinJ toxin-antitoxin module
VERRLIRSKAFVRAARKLIKKNPAAADAVRSTLELLSKDAFDPQLKTHKLKGDLEGSLACAVAYDLRIVFQFLQHEGAEAILVETIGTHEEAY